MFNAPGVALSVQEEPNPDGVRVSASGSGGPAPVVAFCTMLARYFLDPGDSIVVTCGSVTTRVLSGSVRSWFGSLQATLSAGTRVTITEPTAGSYTILNQAASTGPVVVGGISIQPGQIVAGVVDTDLDGLLDVAETNTGVFNGPGDLGTSPTTSDTDLDGLPDGSEFGVYGTNPVAADTDSDGCGDGTEFGTSATAGGRRDPLSFWDYYDVWTHPPSNPNGWQRNKAIDLFNDIFGVANRFGSHGTVPSTDQQRVAAALTPPTSNTGYHIDYDRSAPAPGADRWDMGPPNGTIDLFTDIFGVAFQFGHHCT